MVESMSGEDRAKSVVVVVRRRPRLRVYFRAYPRTAENPTPAQLLSRILFGEVAKRAGGVRYAKRGEGLPPAAEEVAKALKGVRFEPHVERLPEWVRRLGEALGLSEEERRRLEERVREALASGEELEER